MSWYFALATVYTVYFSNGIYYYNRHQPLGSRLLIVFISQLLPAFLWFGAGFFRGVSHGF